MLTAVRTNAVTSHGGWVEWSLQRGGERRAWAFWRLAPELLTLLKREPPLLLHEPTLVTLWSEKFIGFGPMFGIYKSKKKMCQIYNSTIFLPLFCFVVHLFNPYSCWILFFDLLLPSDADADAEHSSIRNTTYFSYYFPLVLSHLPLPTPCR